MWQLTFYDYLMNRDKKYNVPLEVKQNAIELLVRVNKLIEKLEIVGIVLEKSPTGFGLVSSGWRPPEINASIINAAPRSKHMTGEAVDLFDPEGDIDEYIMGFTEHNGMTNKLLESCGLYMEHPAATKGWCHLQMIPPRSLRRVFYP